MKDLSKYVWGIGFIFVGLILLGKSFDLYEFDLFFDGWWTVFIIVPSIVDLFTKENKITSSLFLVLGIALFCAANDWIEYRNVFSIFWCLVFIAIGIKIIINRHVDIKFKKSKDLPEYAGIFGGCEERCTPKYKGGSALAIFGSVDLDLSDVELKEDIHIDVFCMFGGITLKTNDKIEVISSTFNVFGGTENKNRTNTKKYKVFVDGFCMFGAIEIK